MKNKLQDKVNSILYEYSLGPNNYHIGSGLGGNLLYLAFSLDKQNIFTRSIKDIKYENRKFYWNPCYLNTETKTNIRSKLDEIIKKAIENEKFELLNEQITFCSYICVKFAEYLDNNIHFNSGFSYNEFINTIIKYDPSIVISSIRKHIGIERIIKYNLDEDKRLEQLFKSFNNTINGF